MVDKFTDPLPFIAVVETYVLRSLRDFGLTKHIRMSRRYRRRIGMADA